MNQTRKYLTLGIGHGLNDCVSGYIIGSLFHLGYSPFELGIYTLLYNLIAFGGQIVFAKIFERFFSPKKYIIGSFLLLVFSLTFLDIVTEFSILFSGIASAIIHVTGGTEATREDDKSFGLGIFASPGIVGLITGGFLAFMGIKFILIGISLCLVYILLVFFTYHQTPTSYKVSNSHESSFDRHDILMCILLTIISLRSFIWDIVQMIEQQNYNSLFIIAISAMFGKVVGGLISDKIGHKKYSMFALFLSIPFLTFFRKSLISLSIGVFLLQSTIPATTVMIIQLINRKPSIGISISFGLSVLIAITIFHTPAVNFINNNIGILTVLLTATGLLTIFIRLTNRENTLLK